MPKKKDKNQLITVPWNPREITEDEYHQLEKNLQELGDLSGIVHDQNTDWIISGNQRSRVMDINNCEITIVEEFKKPTKTGTTALGYVTWDGERFNYRRVDWTEEQCRKANITANKLGGSWDWDKLANEFDIPELTDWGFSEKELFAFSPDDFGEDFELPSGEKSPLEQITFTLANQQAEEVKRAVAIAKDHDDFEGMETHQNENSNGNALALIVEQWLNSLPSD